MKKINFKKLAMVILVFTLIVSNAVPAFAAPAATKNLTIKFSIKPVGVQDLSGYKAICVSQATPNQQKKSVSKNGSVEFKLKNLSASVNNQLLLFDANQQCVGGFMITLNSANANSISVQGTPKAAYAITVNYTQDTKAIVLNTTINANKYWEYRTFDFIKKSGSSQQPKQPQQPQPPKQPQPGSNPPPNEPIVDSDMQGHEPRPDENFVDPDMRGVEPPPEEFFEDPGMHEDGPPEEFFEDPNMRRDGQQSFEDSNMQWGGPQRLNLGYYIAFGVVGLGIILCILLLMNRKTNRKNSANEKDGYKE